jgi:Cdc6-like AAA superfamily ATPase
LQYNQQVKAAKYLRVFLADRPKLISSVSDPSSRIPGKFVKRDVLTWNILDDGTVGRYSPCNPEQRKAVESLKFNLEVIQGPPGTGKSAIIFHILRSRLRDDSKAVVTTVSYVRVTDSENLFLTFIL